MVDRALHHNPTVKFMLEKMAEVGWAAVPRMVMPLMGRWVVLLCRWLLLLPSS